MKKSKESLSARPKVRNSNVFNEAKVAFEPLNKKMINFIDQDGKKKSIAFISKEFNIKMNSVLFYEPKFEELNSLNQMTLHNWILNCRKYEAMLNQLVSMPYFRFWSVISYNREVITSLESYLFNATRSYRLHPVMKNNEIRVLLSSIHKLVFKVWIRVLLPKETDKNFMLQSYHFEIVRQILDIPKLFSLIQLYGYGPNSEILRVLLKPFISLENTIFKEDFTETCKDITGLFKNYIDNNFNLEGDFLPSLYNFVSNVTDVMFTLNKLVLFNTKLSTVYVESGLAEELVAFYSKYFSFIESKCAEMFQSGQIVENMFKFLKSQLLLTQTSSLLLFHRIFQNDFVQRINQNGKDTQVFDALITMLNSVISQKRFCFDFFTRFSFEAEFKSLLVNRELNEQLSIDDVLEYYKITLKSTIEEHLAQSSCRKNEDLSKLISLSYQPDGQQQQNKQQAPSEPVPAVVVSPPINSVRMDEEITAKEQMIREMFPDFCDGFIYKCLEHYDFDNEKVLDAILDCNLPPHLESLSRELTKNDLLRAQELAMQRAAEAQKQSTNIAQFNPTFKRDPVPSKIAQYDPTSKKDLVPSKIFIGKKDKYSEEMAHKDANKNVTMMLMQKMNAEEEEARKNIVKLIERGKLTKSEQQTNEEYMGLYDDEFDDTYENEDVSFDAAIDETFNDNEEEEEDGDQQNGNFPPLGGPPQDGSQRQTNDKFAASQRYSRKQFFNKRNFKQGNQAPTQQNQQHSQQPQNSQMSAPRQQPSQQPPAYSQQNRQQQQQNQQNHHGQQPPRRNNARGGGHTNSNPHPNSNSNASNQPPPAPSKTEPKPEAKPGPRSHPLPKPDGDNSSSNNRGGGNRNRGSRGHVRSYHGFSGGGRVGGGGGR